MEIFNPNSNIDFLAWRKSQHDNLGHPADHLARRRSSRAA